VTSTPPCRASTPTTVSSSYMAFAPAWFFFVLSAACCAILAASAAPEGMLDTDPAAASCRLAPDGSPYCKGEDVQLYQHDLSLNQRRLQRDVSDMSTIESGIDPSATSECVEVPLDSQTHEAGRGSGWTQRLTHLEDACLNWNPSQAEEPPRPSGCLGPLAQLVGTWQGFGHATIWEPVAPFPSMQLQGPRFTVAPRYYETLTFKPIIGTAVNKGYSGNKHMNAKCRVEQALQGLTYTQEVHISWGGELHKLLHAETGALMYNAVPGGDSNWTVSRMGALARGITFNAHGNHQEYQGDDVKSRLIRELSALDLRTTPTDKCIDYLSKVEAEYDSNMTSSVDMHSYLIDHSYAIEPIEQSSTVERVTKIDFPQATILNSPFLDKAAKTTNFKSTFFIESVRLENGDLEQRLQYAQSCQLEFSQRLDCISCPGLSRDANGCYPQVTKNLSGCFVDVSRDPSCSQKPYISWPHVQVADLKRVA